MVMAGELIDPNERRSGSARLFSAYRKSASHGGYREGAGRKTDAERLRPLQAAELQNEREAADAFGRHLQNWLHALGEAGGLGCSVCLGDSSLALHPAGRCEFIYRGLDLTCADVPRWSARERKTIGAAPPLAMLQDHLGSWAAKTPIALFGFCEGGGTKVGVRGLLGELNHHAHLQAKGWMCEVEEARMLWSLGFANGGRAVSVASENERRLQSSFGEGAMVGDNLRSLYVAKHASKDVGELGLLPIFRKSFGVAPLEYL